MNSYDIFISYRHVGSFETATLIADRLKLAGYRVFFDVEALKSGKFNEKLYAAIEQCTDFIVVLPKNGLDHCIDPEDWVRLEIQHALKHQKNIIPVLLRDFEFPKELPDGMKGLEHYQAVVANSHDYFDASIVKLRSYLKSKNGFNWRRYKKQLVAIITVLIIILGIFSYFYIRGLKLLERDCQKETMLMASEIVKMNISLKEASEAQAEWEKYLVKFASAEPGDTAYLRKQFDTYINYALDHALSPTSGLMLSAESSVTMALHGVKVEEIVGFYKMLMPDFFVEVTDYLNLLKVYSRMPFVSETIAKNIQLNYKSLVLSAKGSYICYLGLLTTMPKAVYSDDFYKMRSQLGMFSDIPVNRSYKEYESDAELVMQEYENIVLEIGDNLKNGEIRVEEMQHHLDQLKADESKTKK